MGEYTGIKDYKGIEIFEGDIVKGYLRHQESEFLSTVIFKDGMFKLWFNKVHGTIIYEDMTYYNAIEFEVIGNIFENKDLLDN